MPPAISSTCRGGAPAGKVDGESVAGGEWQFVTDVVNAARQFLFPGEGRTMVYHIEPHGSDGRWRLWFRDEDGDLCELFCLTRQVAEEWQKRLAASEKRRAWMFAIGEPLRERGVVEIGRAHV